MWEHGKSWFILIVGLLLTTFGLVPLLNQWNVIAFDIPFIESLMGTALAYILALAGLFLIVDGVMEGGFTHPWGMISVTVGFLVLLLGVIPLLNTFGVISFGIPGLDLIVYRIIFTIEGVMAIIGAWSLQ